MFNAEFVFIRWIDFTCLSSRIMTHKTRRAAGCIIHRTVHNKQKSRESIRDMGQLHDVIMSVTPRVEYDEESDNGLVVCDRYVPAELLAEIFCHVDHKTLLNCQLVCKRWKALIQNYVWRKKAEMTLGKPFPRHEQISWEMFYLIYKKKPFEKNLLKNHSGEHGKKHWHIVREGGDCWAIERPPVGVPDLPLTEPVFEGKQICFTTSYYNCTKTQIIDLVAEGLHPYVLDVLQPPITVSEYYSARWDCPAVYECQVKLLGIGDDTNRNVKTLDEFKFQENLIGDKQNQWLQVSHIFENYGEGLRKISFMHGGMDQSFWAGHYGSKMAGACICIKVPPVRYSYDDESDTQDE